MKFILILLIITGCSRRELIQKKIENKTIIFSPTSGYVEYNEIKDFACISTSSGGIWCERINFE